jgi:putative mRNA 3-end processing factor
MLQFTDKGIYCAQADIYIDPWQPVEKAVITHGHSDHARAGSKKYLCHTHTVPILKLRLGEDVQAEGLAYGEVVHINGVSVSLHPAGHIIGSAQVRLEYNGDIWVVSGDYKLMHDGLSTPFEPVKCHHFVTESTFGLPIYKFPEPRMVYEKINEWWQHNAAEGINTILLGYALGKAQTILKHLDISIGSVYLHGAVDNVNNALITEGFHFAGTRITPETETQAIRGAMILAPPSALGTPWMKRFTPYRVAVCSGWMQLRGTRRRYGVDRGFVLSDHCDWPQLNTAIKETGAGEIFITHGYEGPFARWQREEHGLITHEVRTLFNAEGNEDL